MYVTPLKGKPWQRSHHLPFLQVKSNEFIVHVRRWQKYPTPLPSCTQMMMSLVLVPVSIRRMGPFISRFFLNRAGRSNSTHWKFDNRLHKRPQITIMYGTSRKDCGLKSFIWCKWRIYQDVRAEEQRHVGHHPEFGAAVARERDRFSAVPYLLWEPWAMINFCSMNKAHEFNKLEVGEATGRIEYNYAHAVYSCFTPPLPTNRWSTGDPATLAQPHQHIYDRGDNA